MRLAPALPFADALAAEQVQQALQDEGVTFRHRLFSPLGTVWVFLSQVLDPDHSCRAAVARFQAWRAARGLAPCAADTGAYCKARQRLPEGVLARLTRATGRQPQDEAPPAWRWDGRTVKVVDGTTVSMPDTPANQAAFPQSRSQTADVGFPIARLVVLFSLAVGTALDAALGRYQGKQTGEAALFHQLHENLEPGDVLLADRYYASYWEIALAQQRGADVVTRLHQRRQADFRRGRRLGREYHVVVYAKPARPAWMDQATYDAWPPTLSVREVRVRHPGLRRRVLVFVTSLRDPAETPRSDVAELSRMRWLAELDLRALKQTSKMNILRCKSPGLVRKEVGTLLPGYNLVRQAMARAAQEAKLLPVQLSFKGAVQALNGFTGVAWTAGVGELAGLGQRLREALAQQRVGERPNRYEPRACKRRPKEYPLLNEPRDQARARCCSGRYG